MARAGAKIRDRDRGYRRLREAARSMSGGGSRIDVGIMGAEALERAKRTPTLSVVDIAGMHEFGLGVPRRAFVSGWFDVTREKNRATIKRGAQAVMRGKLALEQLLGQLGSHFKGGMQARISARAYKENATSTVERKGSSTPLVDTGQLRAAITYRVTT